MTRRELHALMTVARSGICGHFPVRCAEESLELLEAAEEVYANSEGFRGSIEALEMAARSAIETYTTNPLRFLACMDELKKALAALEPSSNRKGENNESDSA